MVKSWFAGGDGYDMEDIWANRIGREFADRLFAYHQGQGPPVMPSNVIREAEEFRPHQVELEQTHDQPVPDSSPAQ